MFRNSHSKGRVPAFVSLWILSVSTGLSGQQATTGPSGPVRISVSEAIHRAQQNEPVFANAVAFERSAETAKYIAKAALLPSINYHNQMIYTQPNGQKDPAVAPGLMNSPIFIANNAIHEYVSQGVLTETIGAKQIADAQVASADAARAKANLEITRRGLVSAVVSLYYDVASSEEKRRLLVEALAEAQSFTKLSQERESAREVSHADVVKAQLQQQQRQRDLNDAVVLADRARLELAVLLFPDPRTPYLTEETANPPALPTQGEVNQLASLNSPEMRSALAEVSSANAAVRSAKFAYLPDLALNFNYGIDAPQFAKRGGAPDNLNNLGYSITGTVDVPVWDWLTTQKRIRQSEIQRDAARVTLTAAQRRLIAILEETYAEAVVADKQLALLDQSVKTAEESLRLTKLRYSAGESTALEVVDAQNADLSAKTAQADGIVRYRTALASLNILTGQL